MTGVQTCALPISPPIKSKMPMIPIKNGFIFKMNFGKIQKLNARLKEYAAKMRYIKNITKFIFFII